MSMTSVATPIWNEIAKTQKLKTKWARKVFKMEPDQMAEEESREYQELISKQIPHKVASAFLDSKPLLLENEAISRHIQKTNNLELRTALPELTTITEAMNLVSMENQLNPSHRKMLVKLLRESMN